MRPQAVASPLLDLHRLGLASLLATTAVLTGCGVGRLTPPSSAPGASLRGVVHGGQQPVAGAHVYVFAANATGFGGPLFAPSGANASISLLNAAATHLSDSTGAYVLSDANGNFDISGDYTCTANSQVYLYAHGGDAGAGPNSAAGFLAIVGNCPAAGNFSAVPLIEMNEVSTVAAAYSFAAFASDPIHVSSNGSPQGLTGIANAFATASNLVDLGSGTALALTPAGNGYPPNTTINTLANILAACVNTADSISPSISNRPVSGSPRPHGETLPYSAPCLALGEASSGNNLNQFAGYTYDTATAAIFIAQQPGANTAALYALPTPQAPFSPVLSSQPNDFTVGIYYNGGGLYYPYSIAIDAQGNIWLGDDGAALTELSPLGLPLSPSGGFTGGGIGLSYSISIDTSGDPWLPNYEGSAVAEFSGAGTALSSTGYTGGGMGLPDGSAFDLDGNLWVANYSAGVSRLSSSGIPSNMSGYTGGGLDDSESLAIDGAGNIWVANYANSLTKLSSSGTPISSSTGYTGGGLNQPYSIAIDHTGNVWAANYNGSTLSEFSSAGAAISTSLGYTGGGLASPSGIAIDGAGNVWAANYDASSVSEFSNSGTAISPSTGYTAAAAVEYPYAIAVDSAGNVWTTGYGYFASEIVGVAAPVETPIVQALQDNCIAHIPCIPPS